MDPGGNEKHQIWMMDMNTLEASKLTKLDDAIYNFGTFSPDGSHICYSSNERDERFFDIYTQSIQTGESRLLYGSDDHNYPVDWISRNMLVIGRTNTNLDNDLFLLSTKGESRSD